MIKRLIFDIDGTLIRNVSFKEAIKKTLETLNICTEQNIIAFLNAIKTYEQYYNSYNKIDYLNYFSKSLQVPLDENFLNIFFSYLRYLIPEDSAQIKTIIASLSEKYELVLLSNYFEISQRNRLEEMGINQYFKEYYGQDIIKPNLEAYLAAAGNRAFKECVMIGDNIDLDIKIPQSLGMHTILIGDEKPAVRILELKNIL